METIVTTITIGNVETVVTTCVAITIENDENTVTTNSITIVTIETTKFFTVEIVVTTSIVLLLKIMKLL